MTEPILIKAGSDRLKLGLNEQPPSVDCRVVEENNYQALKRAFDLHSVSQRSEPFINFTKEVIEQWEEYDIGDEDIYNKAIK